MVRSGADRCVGESCSNDLSCLARASEPTGGRDLLLSNQTAANAELESIGES
jgi:hypothetical protein